MATKSVTDGNFETDVIKSEKPTVVDFWQNGVDLANKLDQR